MNVYLLASYGLPYFLLLQSYSSYTDSANDVSITTEQADSSSYLQNRNTSQHKITVLLLCSLL